MVPCPRVQGLRETKQRKLKYEEVFHGSFECVWIQLNRYNVYFPFEVRDP